MDDHNLEYGFVDLNPEEMAEFMSLDGDDKQAFLLSMIEDRAKYIEPDQFMDMVLTDILTDDEEKKIQGHFWSPFADAVDGFGYMAFPDIVMCKYHFIVGHSMLVNAKAIPRGRQ